MKPDDFKDLAIWMPKPGELWKFHGDLMLVVDIDEDEVQFFDYKGKIYRKVNRALMNAVLRHDPKEIFLVSKKSNISNSYVKEDSL